MGNYLNGRSIWPWLDPISDYEDVPPAGGVWPKISIVTPNYNYGHLIEGTIRSVLVQDYPNLEYIIIDDGSGDDSVQIIEKYESKLGYFEHQKNQGQYPTINKGFSKATGEICGWINSDDVYLPWTFRVVGRIFAEFPEVDWIVGQPSGIQDGVVHSIYATRPYPRAMIRAGLFNDNAGDGVRGGCIQQESCFWRRGLWEKAGGLRVDLQYAADFELWTRFAQHAELYSVSTLLGGFTDRGKANRSIANRDKYQNEVRQVVAELRAAANSREAIVAKKLAILTALQRKSRFVDIASVVKRFIWLGELEGPLLRWDFKESRYRRARACFV
jgi:glycosyltransferase involved in cell wall biosynthesis